MAPKVSQNVRVVVNNILDGIKLKKSKGKRYLSVGKRRKRLITNKSNEDIIKMLKSFISKVVKHARKKDPNIGAQSLQNSVIPLLTASTQTNGLFRREVESSGVKIRDLSKLVTDLTESNISNQKLITNERQIEKELLALEYIPQKLRIVRDQILYEQESLPPTDKKFTMDELRNMNSIRLRNVLSNIRLKTNTLKAPPESPFTKVKPLNIKQDKQAEATQTDFPIRLPDTAEEKPKTDVPKKGKAKKQDDVDKKSKSELIDELLSKEDSYDKDALTLLPREELEDLVKLAPDIQPTQDEEPPSQADDPKGKKKKKLKKGEVMVIKKQTIPKKDAETQDIENIEQTEIIGEDIGEQSGGSQRPQTREQVLRILKRQIGRGVTLRQWNKALALYNKNKDKLTEQQRAQYNNMISGVTANIVRGENLDRAEQVMDLLNEFGEQVGGGMANKGLSNQQIDKIMKDEDGWRGVFALDTLKDFKPFDGRKASSKQKKMSIIINTMPFPEDGHWVSLRMEPGVLEYYDPLGRPPSKEMMTEIRRLSKGLKKRDGSKVQIKINRIRHQGGSLNCGYFAIKQLMDRQAGKTWKESTEYYIMQKAIQEAGEKSIEAFKKEMPDFKYI